MTRKSRKLSEDQGKCMGTKGGEGGKRRNYSDNTVTETILHGMNLILLQGPRILYFPVTSQQSLQGTMMSSLMKEETYFMSDSHTACCLERRDCPLDSCLPNPSPLPVFFKQ